MKLQGLLLRSIKDDKVVYIQQEDALFAQLTTVETLETSYSFSDIKMMADNSNIERQIDPKRKDKVVSSLLNELGLKKVTNSKVGDIKVNILCNS